MIDGVKILCIDTDAADWLSCSELDFDITANEDTGVILKRVANYKGLNFILKPSTTSKDYHCILTGSLAKYYNNGIDNTIDFNISQLYEVIQELHNKYKINPQTTIIQHLETGANVELETPVKTVLQSIVTYKNRIQKRYIQDNTDLGVTFERQEYQFKFYDKGKQAKKNKNLFRVEYAINSQKKARKYKIEVLADLLNNDKLNLLKNEIISTWEDVIYLDKKALQYKEMTNSQQKRMLYLANPKNWWNLNKHQIYNNNKRFRELYKRYSNCQKQQIISHKIALKLDELTAKNKRPFTLLSKSKNNNNAAHNMRPFTPLDKSVKRRILYPTNNNNKLYNILVENSPKNKYLKCKVCKKDITHKRTGAKYCSKKCNNIRNGQQRTIRNQHHRKQETTLLKELIQILVNNGFWLIIHYKKNSIHFSDYLHSSEINAPPDWTRKVFKIEIQMKLASMTGNTATLTTLRAKQLLDKINDKNNKIK